MNAPLDHRPTVLYRFYDAAGQLLYVGISVDFPHRAASHRRRQCWWRDRARTTLQFFPSRATAEEAERLAIRAEHPRYNVVHNASQEELR